jgi:hypothetical protein
MKRSCFACLFLCLATTFLLSQSNPISPINQTPRPMSSISASQADRNAHARILDSYGALPLSFEANHGQTDSRVKFLSRTRGYSLFLTGDEAVLALSKKKGAYAPGEDSANRRHAEVGPGAGEASRVLRMKLRNANPAARVMGLDELAGTSNYFIGNDPAKWRTSVPTYAKVKYEGVYSGIDLVYYGNQRQLEYDFIVAPGADPRRIEFDIRGAKRIRRDGHGDLVLRLGEDEIRWHKPLVYQEKGGTRQEIAAHYAITNKNRVGFEVAEYDPGRPLYIDPLIYSTYLGGCCADVAFGIAVDSAGSAYVTGYTSSSNFPTKNPLQPANAGGGDTFVTKINPSGSALVYSTYLGGSGADLGRGIAVDSAGNAYVSGFTSSTDFPTKNPLQAANGGGSDDAFVAKLNPGGSALVYSTYLGGSANDRGTAVAVDSSGNAYITGLTGSTNFPTTPGAFQTACGNGCVNADAFVSKLNPAGSALIYSSYLGGYGSEEADGLAVDSTGNAYVTGYNQGGDFPTTPGAYHTTCSNRCQYPEPIVTKFNPAGSALVYSTYLGGTIFDVGNGIAVDSAGDAYIIGTKSLDGKRVLIYKLNATGSALVYGHQLKSFDSTGNGIAVDSSGSAYITGKAHLRNFVGKLTPSGSFFLSSLYLTGNGQQESFGVAIDNSNHAYIAGYTSSTDFPTKNPFQGTLGGGEDAFVSKADMRTTTTTKISSSLNPSIYGQSVTFTAVVTSSGGSVPDGETVTFMRGAMVLGTGTLSGGSASFTTSTLKAGTNPIKAVYIGDANLLDSTSNAVKQVVNKATTTTAVASSQNPSNSGQPVTFTASVTPQFSNTVTGRVTFYDGATALKTVSLSGGAAEFTTSTLTPGTHTITATYSGSANFIGSSDSLTQTVN